MRTFMIAMAAAAMLVAPMNGLAQDSLGTSTTGSRSPVTINSCQPRLSPASSASPNPNPLVALLQPSTSNGIHIQFTNESTKTADLVNFDVNSNGSHFVIRDVGTFSPGISIDHRYSNGAGQAYILPAFIAPKIHCRVASVRFTDGSVWPVPPGTAATQARGNSVLSVNPKSVRIDTRLESALFMVSATERVAGFKEADTCSGIATVYVTATAQTSAVYTVKPVAAGTCTATISDETGQTVSVPITVQ